MIWSAIQLIHYRIRNASLVLRVARTQQLEARDHALLLQLPGGVGVLDDSFIIEQARDNEEGERRRRRGRQRGKAMKVDAGAGDDGGFLRTYQSFGRE